MPWRASHPCAQPGCPALAKGNARCHEHAASYRPNSNARGYDATWRKLRGLHLHRHPLCAECELRGLVVKATDVDHVKAHRGDDALRLDPSNLRSLCHPHHSQKTAAIDHGFGR